jgi:PAS domain S-box-containing protein
MKKKPYDYPKLIRYESDDEIPSSFRSFAQSFRKGAQAKYGAQVAPDYTVVIDADRKYVEVSDSFCELLGYPREQLIGKRFDVVTAPRTNNIPVVFGLFARTGYMHGLWMLLTRTGARIVVRYEAWVRPDCQIQKIMELVDPGC